MKFAKIFAFLPTYELIKKNMRPANLALKFNFKTKNSRVIPFQNDEGISFSFKL